MTDIPSLIRLPQLLVRLGLFNTYKSAETQAKRGNIYIEIHPNSEYAYWMRMTDVEGIVCIPESTRIKYIDDNGVAQIRDVVPHKGRTRGDDGA